MHMNNNDIHGDLSLHLKNKIPIFDWLPKLEKSEVLQDIIAGLTLSTLTIPQALAYAVLAGVEPVYGLYACLVPVFIYSIFGTSRHLAGGAFALMSLLLNNYSDEVIKSSLLYSNKTNVILVLSLATGFVQLAMYFLKLGKLVSRNLDKDIVSGAITCITLLILFSQLETFLGIKIKTNYKYFKLARITYDIVTDKIKIIHVPTFIIGIVSILSIVFLDKINKLVSDIKNDEPVVVSNLDTNNETNRLLPSLVSNSKKRNKIRFCIKSINIPSIFVTIITLSTIFYLNQSFFVNGLKIDVVGRIPKGLPGAKVPKIIVTNLFEIFLIFKHSTTLAIIGYLLSVSVAQTFSIKANYNISEDQELLAFSISNIVGPIFGGYASCASLTRTAVAYNLGSRSQLTHIVNAVVIYIVLQFITKPFEYIPKSTLSGIIIIACLKLVKEVLKLKQKFINNKKEFKMWVFAFLVVFTFDVSLSMYIFVLFVIIYRLRQRYQH